VTPAQAIRVASAVTILELNIWWLAITAIIEGQIWCRGADLVHHPVGGTVLRGAEALAFTLLAHLVIFAATWYQMNRPILRPLGPASRLDSLYFSATVFITAGFADISPRHRLAQAGVRQFRGSWVTVSRPVSGLLSSDLSQN
jgi:hypothetical protein